MQYKTIDCRSKLSDVHHQLVVDQEEIVSDLHEDVGVREQSCTKSDTQSVCFTNNLDPTAINTSLSYGTISNQVRIMNYDSSKKQHKMLKNDHS